MSFLSKNRNRSREVLFLGVLSLLCFGFSLFRIDYSNTQTFFFLNWNLFLAFIPWALTTLLMFRSDGKVNKYLLMGVLFCWLLFFPNAPYILTDLFHLRLDTNMPIWFDLVLILSFAWTGLLFGLLSLMDIEIMIRRTLKTPWSMAVISILLFVSSFGIYVGRYLRWNSWDIIADPFSLIYDVGHRIIKPWEHPRAWGLTIFMGVFLNMIYWSFRFIRLRRQEETL